MNKILVDKGEKLALKRLFKTSYPTVRKALSGKSDSKLTYQIRQAALERGGLEVTPKKAPDDTGASRSQREAVKSQ